ERYIKKFTKTNKSPSKIIVSMGRLHKVKGFDILIKAFLIVLNTYNDAILLIAGKNVGEKDNLDKLIEEYNLSDRVFFCR
ncbi:MAG: glycosyltransferase, partial [Methylococcales bacterium]|nr:glycosyltransferase [Methylococcales bacterium]